jgi:hypothetical protein
MVPFGHRHRALDAMNFICVCFYSALQIVHTLFKVLNMNTDGCQRRWWKMSESSVHTHTENIKKNCIVVEAKSLYCAKEIDPSLAEISDSFGTLLYRK